MCPSSDDCIAKGKAELKERQAWSEKWHQRRKEERLRQQQAKLQQEVDHALKVSARVRVLAPTGKV